ncbi:hypothetical protein ES332_D08G140700v1 [Gossypium tomentosum]|uniref:Uncharacterized protein n=1 Tax=Gossypium tomentosum TaxID=34277 RepID=A0A5D2JUV6_GOSTO|nr:hypothetical protein ES332_D08G140700v1 [Gossypium tomentosum]
MIRDFVFYRAPPATFPCRDGKLKAISLLEDVYNKKFFQKYPLSKGHDAIKYRLFKLHVGLILCATGFDNSTSTYLPGYTE